MSDLHDAPNWKSFVRRADVSVDVAVDAFYEFLRNWQDGPPRPPPVPDRPWDALGLTAQEYEWLRSREDIRKFVVHVKRDLGPISGSPS